MTSEDASINLKGTSALCIGAGLEQLPTIQFAQQMGLRVIAVDGNSQAAGLTIADRGIVMNIRDTQCVIELAATEQICCVLPVPLGEILTTVGAVNDALGLCGISEQAARYCTDKTLTNQRLTIAKLQTPRLITATTADEISAAAAEIGFPVVIKPRYGSGSQGVFVARTSIELQHYLPWHLQQRQRYAPHTLVEAFISGREVGIDGAIVDDQLILLLIRDKEVTELPFRLPYAYLAPANITNEQQQQIRMTVEQAIATLGLKNCLLHADLILGQDGQTYLIDISGRPSGFNLSAKLVPAAIGINPIQQTILMSLGHSTDFQPKTQRGAVLRMLAARAGRLSTVTGIEQARSLPGVVAADCFLQPGDMIQERRTGMDGYRVGYILTTAATRVEADLLWHQAAQMIHFQVD